jgi:hypothetical protein
LGIGKNFFPFPVSKNPHSVILLNGDPESGDFYAAQPFWFNTFYGKFFRKTHESVQSSGGLNSMGVTINASQSVL